MNALCHTHTPHTDNTLQLVHAKTRGGAIYQLVPFNGMLVAAVHNDVQILTWSEEEKVLEDVCSYSNNILALFVKTKGDFILVCKSEPCSARSLLAILMKFH